MAVKQFFGIIICKNYKKLMQEGWPGAELSGCFFGHQEISERILGIRFLSWVWTKKAFPSSAIKARKR